MGEAKLLDYQFKYRVASRPGGEGLLACFACGVCTAACPVSEVEKGFNPRRIIHQILLGESEELLRSERIWLCVGCYRCSAHCPQDVEFTNLLKVLRELAVEEGAVSAEWKKVVDEVDRRTQELRRKLIEYLWNKGINSLEEFEKFYQKEIAKLDWVKGDSDDAQ